MRLMRNVFAVAAFMAAYGAMPAHAADKVCKLEIAGNDLMQYDQKELKVDADCTSVEVTLKHTGKLPAAAMGHNWTLVKTADLNGVVSDGLAAGLPNDYLKPGDKRVIAHTCTFPGHSALMKGKLTFG
jgi:azurin